MLKTILCISLICIMVFGFCCVARADLVGVDDELINPTEHQTFADLIGSIIEWLKTIGMSIAVMMIVYSGFLFMTAGGNEVKIAKARMALTWSLVGLGIIIISGSLIPLIKNILGVTTP